MKRRKLVKPVEITKDGEIVFNLCASEAGDDWLNYGRLKKLANEGDEEARIECERMDNSLMFTIEEIDEVE